MKNLLWTLAAIVVIIWIGGTLNGAGSSLDGCGTYTDCPDPYGP